MVGEWDGLRGALYGLAALPLLFALGWTFVEACLRPRLIADRDIERLADAVMAQHPDDPEEAAFAGEHAAWLRSAMIEQGTWRRVRKVIRRRLV